MGAAPRRDFRRTAPALLYWRCRPCRTAARKPRHPGKVDDFAASVLQHLRKNCASQVETAQKIDFHCCGPVVLRNLGSRSHGTQNARAIHKRIQAAELANHIAVASSFGVCSECRNGASIRDRAPFFPVGKLGGQIRLIRESKPRALLEEFARDRLADHSGSACDEAKPCQ